MFKDVSDHVQEAQNKLRELPEEIIDSDWADELPEEIVDKDGADELPDEIIDRKTVENASADDTERESDCLSSYKERIDRTPSEYSDRGEWTGIRGESVYIPFDKDMKSLLAKFGLKGIEYKDGIPDFFKCSAATVKIDSMSVKRYENFAQADAKCAEQWSKEGKGGKTDWTARYVEKWRESNGYSWHERNDRETCDLIPTAVNDYFGHFGGVAECKKRDIAQSDGGEFDE